MKRRSRLSKSTYYPNEKRQPTNQFCDWRQVYYYASSLKNLLFTLALTLRACACLFSKRTNAALKKREKKCCYWSSSKLTLFFDIISLDRGKLGADKRVVCSDPVVYVPIDLKSRCSYLAPTSLHYAWHFTNFIFSHAFSEYYLAAVAENHFPPWNLTAYQNHHFWKLSFVCWTLYLRFLQRYRITQTENPSMAFFLNTHSFFFCKDQKDFFF